ncbi:atp-dependent dna helicase : ATP-dependent DNA helicase PcrA OS=Clostridium acidurici (strain ATCC 7906 / DSM 604 / KCTC 5404 / 9a) GN=pcrA PE=4 SV=1: UvrD-helicase: UvrD_C [Gemmataceae bacterium]|nr:atp-dependent dna helicase : ATP-dependent DNA helicase PcrA OS=Clostridium acidurici (strain ATCC 7906 / DSM 604 / KCTC 5404 / 9a) GN=pcrA PE=4 SV=1: UvrD-helicase: UvrD_C [Gemmataceae bacterium]VTT99442.1 atp-dependent dna helicase : ATP-dependent DNA helicase PcrA OS=Clostridium acidurici (strain ATCC 7906 / DSM 604 / KCTC 5404 / 9a) GN=pcrA PE=4 SV=1: UvrD-helicase: UvrD_C [Gemmataceae bacterium]
MHQPLARDLLADLTDDQRAAVMHGEGPLLILAGAGSGKTRVITRRVAYLLSQGIRPSNILAITFTNKAAGEMRSRVEQLVPGNRVLVSTFHALGARLLRQYGERLGFDRNFTIYDMDDRNKVVKAALEATGIDNVKFSPERIGGAISKAKNALVTPPEFEKTATDFFAQTVAKVYRGYEKRLRAANAMDFDDLLYLPAMALKHNEELRAELDARFRYVLIDEYQDTNSAQYQVAKRLAIDHPNLCVVGDPDQCLLPGTLVDTPSGPKPIEQIRDGDEVLSGIGWGKVAPMPVDKVMLNPHRGKIIRIQVEGGVTLRATPNHICFGRLRPDPDRHHVYLMWKRGMGYRLGTTRGVRTSKSGPLMSGLQVRTNQEVADAMWVVRTCGTSSEARYFEQLYSVKYGIPTMVFFVRGRGMGISQDLIDQLFREVDTEAGATRLMADLLLDRRYPHHRPGAVTRGEIARRFIQFTVFGDPRPKQEAQRRWHEHRVQLITSGVELREKARSAALPVRNGNKGTWRIETSRKGYDDALALADSINQVDEFETVSRARLTEGKAFPFMPASHLQPGMVVPVRIEGRIEERVVESVTWEEYDGLVYDLSVPNTRNFIANGLVVHNSIYKWRGSDIKNILDFERDFPAARVITLNKNYRSTKTILHAASTVIDHNKQRKKKSLVTDNPQGEPVRVVTYDNGLDEAEGVVVRIKEAVTAGRFKFRDHAIFLRINALTRTLESAFVKHGVPFQIVKGLAFFDRKENKDVLAYLRLLANPADTVSFLRVVNEPPRGIGKVSLDKLQSVAADREMTLMDAAAQVAKLTDIKGKAATGLRDFHKLITELRARLDLPPQDLVRLVLEKSGYSASLRESGEEEDAERLANIEDVVTAAKQFHDQNPESTIVDFLEQITLASDTDGWDEQADHVSVMTLHASKGLEFPVVYVMAVEEGLLPHERSMGREDEIEEERRLCFVGMTRAMKELYLTHARLREFRGQMNYAIESSFLRELPREGVERLDPSMTRNVARTAADEWRAKAGNAASDWADTGARPYIPAKKPTTDLKPTIPDGADTGLAVGVLVQHEELGLGQVTDVSGYGALRRVKIRFPSAGEKTFVADKVKLKVVGRKKTGG